MKTLLVLGALGTVSAAPAFAQPARTTHNYARASNQGWPSRVHVYAPNHYAPSYGNANMNSDRELGSEEE
jgi:hypothetical protein